MWNYSSKIKPFVKWVGGKSRVIDQLLPLFPQKFDTYVEPFLGGGSVLFHLEPNSCNIFASDINNELVNTYRLIQSNHFSKDLPILYNILDFFSYLYSKDFYYYIRNKSWDSSEEGANLLIIARFLFLNKTGYNGLYRVNSKKEFNVPFGKKKECPKLYDKENIENIEKFIRSWNSCNNFFIIKQTCRKFLDFILTATDMNCVPILTKDAFVYCDPPYDDAYNQYSKNAFKHEDQVFLYEKMKEFDQKGIKFAVSNKATDFILNLYKEYNIHFIETTKQISCKTESRSSKFKEVLITNY